MKLTAFRKDIRREFRKSLSRFLSITIIICLGVGFFCGMKATAPTMVRTAQDYFCEQNLMDLKLLSMVGFGDEEVERVQKVDGIKDVFPTYSTDVLAQSPSDTYYKATKVMAFHSNQTMNMLTVVDGRLPQASGECVMCEEGFNGEKYHVGDTMDIYGLAGTTDVSTVLATQEYTVVGIVKSPMYFSYSYGTSSIGDGNLYAFMIVPVSDFLYTRYTELYVTLDIDYSEIEIFSDEYNDKVKAVQEQLDPIGSELTKAFLDDASSQLKDAEKEFDKQKAYAYEQLEKSQRELDEAQLQLESALAQISAGWSEYNTQYASYEEQIKDGERQLSEAKKMIAQYKAKFTASEKEYKAGLDQLNAGRRELDKGWDEYYAGLAEYQAAPAKLAAAKQELEDALKQLNDAKAQYQQGLKEYEDGLKELEAGRAEYQQALDEYNNMKSQWYYQYTGPGLAILAVTKAELESAAQEIADGEAQVAEGKRQLDEAKLQINAGEVEYAAGVKEYDAGMAKYQSSKRELDDALKTLQDSEDEYNIGKKKLDAAKLELEDGRKQIADGDVEIRASERELAEAKASAQGQFEDSRKQLEDAEKQYNDGKKQYDDGKQQLEQARGETERQLNEGAAQILSARNQFTELSATKWYLFSRDDVITNYSGLNQDSGRMGAIADIFPVFFLIVAALVCVTTMSRMVEEQRAQMGTYKALGYSRSQIFRKYLVYSLIAGVLGGIVGQVICVQMFPRIILSAYSIMYRFPGVSIVVPWPMLIISLIAGIACTTLVAFICCRKEVSSVAATLMRPRAPKAGKKILLEKIPFLWDMFNFSFKITIRNLVRYKLRFLMTVVGITGCMALIVSGFGLQDAIADIVNLQFNKLCEYDFMTTMYDPYNSQEAEECLAKLKADDPNIDRVLFVRQMEIDVGANDKTVNMDNTYMMTPRNVDDFEALIHLYNYHGKKSLQLKDGGVIITSKIANNLHLRAGDKIDIYYDGGKYTAPVSGVIENYVYHYIYITPNTLRSLIGVKEIEYNCILGSVKDGTVDSEKLLAGNSNFLTVIRTQDLCDTMDETFNSMYLVILVLILSASALAIVVLYNLTNINISERIREIATIKVLGSNSKESNMYVFRENIIMTIVGIILGCLGGYALAQLMIGMVEVDVVVFSRTIKLASYVYSSLITIATTVLVILLMRRKIRKIDMVEALKSVD